MTKLDGFDNYPRSTYSPAEALPNANDIFIWTLSLATTPHPKSPFPSSFPPRTFPGILNFTFWTKFPPSRSSPYISTSKFDERGRETARSSNPPTMARQSGETKMVRSSLALLQERFNDLQRAKERREQREHMRWISELGQPNHIASPECCRAHFQHQTGHPRLPSRPTPEDCFLSLGLNMHSQRNHSKFRTMNMTPSPNVWPNAASTTSPRTPDYSDVDTSLHL